LAMPVASSSGLRHRGAFDEILESRSRAVDLGQRIGRV
jgi:hypothetical protein